MVTCIAKRSLRHQTSDIIKPDVFAEGKDVTNWLKAFDQYANATLSANGTKRGNCLLSFLDDKSRSQLTHYSSMRNSKLEYTALKENMQRLFQSKQKSSRQYLQLFIARNQEDDETIPKYYAELCDLVIKAYPTTTAQTREEYVFQQLANGVLNPELRKQLILDYENKSKLRDSLDRYTLMEMSMSAQSQASPPEGNNVSISITNTASPAQPATQSCEKSFRDTTTLKRTVNVVQVQLDDTATPQIHSNVESGDVLQENSDGLLLDSNPTVQYVERSDRNHRRHVKDVSFQLPGDKAHSFQNESAPNLADAISIGTLVKETQDLKNTLAKQNQDFMHDLTRTLVDIVPKLNTPTQAASSHPTYPQAYSVPPKIDNVNNSTPPLERRNNQSHTQNSQSHYHDRNPNRIQDVRQYQQSQQHRNAFNLNVQNNTSTNHLTGLKRVDQKKIWYNTKDNKKSVSQIAGALKINGAPARFIADTGCNQTVVHERVFRRNGQMDDLQLTPSSVIVTTANGDELAVSGMLNCNIEIGDTICNTDVIVVPELSQDTLLGIEILSTNPHTSEFIQSLQDKFTSQINRADEQNHKKLRATQSSYDCTNTETTGTTAKTHDNANNSLADMKSITFQVAQVYQTPCIDSTNQLSEENLCDLRKEINTLLEGLMANGLDDLTTTSTIKHKIRIQHGMKPIKQRIRPVPPRKMDEFRQAIDNMVSNKIIRPCKFSAWSSPVNLVVKQDGTLRVTQDYRKLNAANQVDKLKGPVKKRHGRPPRLISKKNDTGESPDNIILPQLVVNAQRNTYNLRKRTKP